MFSPQNLITMHSRRATKKEPTGVPNRKAGKARHNGTKKFSLKASVSSMVDMIVEAARKMKPQRKLTPATPICALLLLVKTKEMQYENGMTLMP